MQNNCEKNLEPGSSTFNTVRAIYDSDFDSSDSVQTHDNVEKCVAFIEGRMKTKSEPNQHNKDPPDDPVRLERQFLPSQLPVQGSRRAPFRHVMTRMEECQTGPLAVLRDCARAGTRVKVWTRGPANIRGVLSGFLVAFDKVSLSQTFVQLLVFVGHKTIIYMTYNKI